MGTCAPIREWNRLSPSQTPLFPLATSRLIGVETIEEIATHTAARVTQPLRRRCQSRWRARPAVKPSAKETIAYDPATGSTVLDVKRLETKPRQPPSQGPPRTPAR